MSLPPPPDPAAPLRAADVAAGELAWIHALTARAEMAAFVVSDPVARLAGYVDDPAKEVLVWAPSSVPEGFAVLARDAVNGRVEVLRVALDRPGRGAGRAYLDAVLDRAFADPDCAKVFLDVAADNPRAIRAYERAGMVREGLLRAHWRRRTGDRADLLLFGILRGEWAALRAAGAGQGG